MATTKRTEARTAKRAAAKRPSTKAASTKAAAKKAAADTLDSGTPPADQAAAKPPGRAARSRAAFPIVGVGASAGGIDALLSSLPEDPGLAFVFVQHLDATHSSHLAEVLGRVTRMPVVEAVRGRRVQPNHVYLIPPNATLSLDGYQLRLGRRLAQTHPFLPIDIFFESLAAEHGTRAIGVVLSGTGTDGTLGLRAIKAAGGITIVQSESSAQFAGMPLSAIAAGAADLVMVPEAIAAQLVKQGHHPLAAAAVRLATESEALETILGLLKTQTGVDFSAYKPSSFGRRLQRRMLLTGIETLAVYAEYLQQHPAEVKGLYDDLFVQVTSFFRDEKLYAGLRRKVFPKLLRRTDSDQPLRFWVPGCASGEEVYSLAMAWLEFVPEPSGALPIQFFGTDISVAAIEKARAGRYPTAITTNVSPERLRRFFVKTSTGYQIAKPVRDLCVFAPHNLLADPPFTQMDLVCCRNVLIYLEPDYQRRILQLFNFALRSTGFLVLGLSEDIGRQSDLFTPIDKQLRIYSKQANGGRPSLLDLLPFRLTGRSTLNPQQQAANRANPEPADQSSVWAAADRVTLSKYSPPSVVINSALDILQFRGHVGGYLEPAPGQPSRNLQKMARDGLQVALPSLVRRAQKTNSPARQTGLRVNVDGRSRTVNVEVIPFQVSRRTPEPYYLVAFEDATPARGGGGRAPAERRPAAAGNGRMALLQRELDDTRESLQAVVEERDSNNEELIAALEELQSGNEELQSTNEELQTAKEELQSANEELTTLNEELENRNQQLSQALGNLTNVVDSVRVPLVIVSGNLHIRLYNAAAERVLNIVATDVGRPIGDIKTRFNISDLTPLITSVMQARRPTDQEVQDREGRWYALRVRPYQTLDHKVDGAVLTWTDISLLRISGNRTGADGSYLTELAATVASPVLVLDADQTVQIANAAFYELFSLTPSEVEHQPLARAGGGMWNIPEVQHLLKELPVDPHVQTLELEHDFPVLGRRALLLTARGLESRPGQPPLTMLVIDDLTLVKQLTEMEQLRQLSGYLQTVREQERTRLSREIHDELGGTLTGLKMQLHHLRNGLTPEQAPLRNMVAAMFEIIDSEVANVRRMASSLRPIILDDYGLMAAIEWQLAEFRQQTGLIVALQSNVESVVLASEAGTAIFRILQETLTNIVRHAGATTVEVKLHAAPGQLHVRVRDDGQGSVPDLLDQADSLGLIGMRERAQQAGGQLEIESEPGQGTTVSLHMPITSFTPSA
jgi:two-component system, chemotaxis family, CheB/CheR fusion protein